MIEALMPPNVAGRPAANKPRADEKPPVDLAVAAKFEAVLLQQAVSSMLPKASQMALGSGVAGDAWRSMLAEQLAGAIVERGGIGLAPAIAASAAAKLNQSKNDESNGADV